MEQSKPTLPTFSLNSLTPKSIGIFIGGILLFGAIVIGALNINTSSNDDHKKEQQAGQATIQKEGNLSPHTLVYGTWTETSSSVLAYDLGTGDSGVIAQLPINIKKISVLSPTQLLFISNTNIKDQGRNISIYNLNTKETKVIYESSEGFGIDDYVISPNKQYIAVWEVQPNSETEVLLNGKSQVYTAKIAGQTIKNVIYQEDALVSNPVRYPVGILDNGTVFMDRFLPNNIAGWGYGMSVSNFIGTEKQDIASMPNGTYSTQPELSPDGKYLLFSGYNNTQGAGENIIDGFKRAQLSSNTIELLDSATLQRQKLSNINENHIYPQVKWDGNDAIIYYQSSQDVTQSGLYRYSLLSHSATKQSPDNAEFFVKSLDSKTKLVGDKQVSTTSVGNLGDSYESPYVHLALVTSNKEIIPLDLDATFAQYIDSLPSNYFDESVYLPSSQSDRSKKDDNLQLSTFTYKPEIEEERQEQQQRPVTSTPAFERQPSQSDGTKPTPTPQSDEETIDCQSMARSICSGQHPDDINAKGLCIQDLKPQLKASGQCNKSPLYLYGVEGKKVSVTINTPVSHTYPPHKGKLTLITHADGSISVDNSVYESLQFDYISAIHRIPQPTYGYVVEKSKLSSTMKKMADNFALNAKETNDLISYANSVAKEKYIFVSFFDHETSHAILPITFNPKPDVYRNIVFYFKNLDQKPNFSIQPPTFDPIDRHGFTAIEISGIVE